MTDNLPAVIQSRGLLASEERFEFGQRAAKLFAASQLIPENLRNNVSDCFIGLHMAERLNEDPLVVLQNIVIIKGKAGWKAQYMIARANSSGVFKGRIKWRVSGTGQTLSVVAHATMADTGEEVESPAVDMAMAKAEGWTVNTKYQSMPEVMLRYRSAAFLVRFNCPEVMLGMQTAEEIDDVVLSGRQPIDGGYAHVDPAHMDAFERAAAGIKPAQIEQAKAQDAPQADPPAEGGRRRPGRPRKADQAPPAADAPQGNPAPVTTFQIVDSNGEIGQFPDEESALQALRGLLNGAATEGEVHSVRAANAKIMGLYPDLEQTFQNRLNGFAEGRREAALATAADVAKDPAPTGGALSIVLKTRGVAETEDGQYQYDLPDQADDYEADFAATFRAHAGTRDVLAFNAAVKEHEPEVARIRDDGRFADLHGRLVKLITECHGLLRKPRPVSTSDMH